MLVLSANGRSGKDWARLEPGAQSSIWISHVAGAQVPGPFHTVSPRYVSLGLAVSYYSEMVREFFKGRMKVKEAVVYMLFHIFTYFFFLRVAVFHVEG